MPGSKMREGAYDHIIVGAGSALCALLHASLIGQRMLDHSSVEWTRTIIRAFTVKLGRTLSKY